MLATKVQRFSKIALSGLLARAVFSERGTLELLNCVLRFEIEKTKNLRLDEEFTGASQHRESIVAVELAQPEQSLPSRR